MDGAIPVPGPASPFQPKATVRSAVVRLAIGMVLLGSVVMVYVTMFHGAS